MRAISVVTAVALLACAGPAFGQSAPPMPPPAPEATPTPAQRAAWQRDYGAARQRLLAGDFAAAAAAFETLARTAPSREDAIAAGELGSLAREWDRRGLAFVQRADLGESTLSAKAAGERTGDEISVLYLGAVFYGLGTGAWLAVQTEPESPAEGILPALGLAGAAVGGVYLADGTGPKLPYGVPQSIVSGMTIGLEQGLVWSLWNQARVERADEWSGKTVATVIWGSATLGAGVGAAVSLAGSTTPGRAAYVSSAALWGSVVSGFGVAALSAEDDMQDDRALLGAAIGLNAAAVGGILAAGPVSPSERIGISAFVQGWLPYISANCQHHLIADAGLRDQYVEARAPALQLRRCGGCGGQLDVVTGARAVVCFRCGKKVSVASELPCPGCGAPSSVPVGSTAYPCPYCGVRIQGTTAPTG